MDLADRNVCCVHRNALDRKQPPARNRQSEPLRMPDRAARPPAEWIWRIGTSVAFNETPWIENNLRPETGKATLYRCRTGRPGRRQNGFGESELLLRLLGRFELTRPSEEKLAKRRIAGAGQDVRPARPQGRSASPEPALPGRAECERRAGARSEQTNRRE